MGIRLQKIKGVLLDLDDTLYSYSGCNDAGKKAVFKFLRTKLKMSDQKIKEFFDQARVETHKILHGQAASHSRLFYIQKCLETILGKTDFKLTLEAEQIFWDSFLLKMRLKPGVLNILKKIKAKGIKIAIVTNLTSEIQFRKILKLKIENYIDFIVTSEEAGKEKPDSKIFKIALQKLCLQPNEVIMVGDDIIADKEGAKKLSIKSFTSLDLLLL